MVRRLDVVNAFSIYMNGFIRTLSHSKWRKTWKAERSPRNHAASSGESYANGAAVVTKPELQGSSHSTPTKWAGSLLLAAWPVLSWTQSKSADIKEQHIGTTPSRCLNNNWQSCLVRWSQGSTAGEELRCRWGARDKDSRTYLRFN